MPLKKNFITLLKDREYSDNHTIRNYFDNATQTIGRALMPTIEFNRDRNYFQNLPRQQQRLIRSYNLTKEQRRAVLNRQPLEFV
jgi:hypothetical protein